MPCYTVQETTIEWSANTDTNAFIEGLKALGLNPVHQGQVINFNGGYYQTGLHKLTLVGTRAEERAKEIRKSYMVEATKAQAKKYGFTARNMKVGKETTFEIVKRTI